MCALCSWFPGALVASGVSAAQGTEALGGEVLWWGRLSPEVKRRELEHLRSRRNPTASNAVIAEYLFQWRRTQSTRSLNKRILSRDGKKNTIWRS